MKIFETRPGASWYMEQSNKIAFLMIQAQISPLECLKVKLPRNRHTVAPTHFQKQVGRGTWLGWFGWWCKVWWSDSSHLDPPLQGLSCIFSRQWKSQLRQVVQGSPSAWRVDQHWDHSSGWSIKHNVLNLYRGKESVLSKEYKAGQIWECESVFLKQLVYCN